MCKLTIFIFEILILIHLSLSVKSEELELKNKFLSDVFEFYENKNIKFNLYLCWPKSK